MLEEEGLFLTVSACLIQQAPEACGLSSISLLQGMGFPVSGFCSVKQPAGPSSLPPIPTLPCTILEQLLRYQKLSINCFPHPQPLEDEFPAGSTSEAPWYLLCHPVGYGQALSNEVWILILGLKSDHIQVYFFLRSSI